LVKAYCAAAALAAACSRVAEVDYSPRPEAARTLYVSLDGDDAWSGAVPEANSQRNDGPLRTLEGARDALRRMRSQGNTAGESDVRILPGYHARTGPFVLEPQDSGAPGGRIRYVGFGNGIATVGGGVALRGFSVGAGGAWTLTIPEVARGEWAFSQLYVGGARRPRPRLPREGYFQVAAAAPPTEAAAPKGFDRFQYAAGDLRDTWHRLPDVEVLGFHIWSMSRMRIASLDPAARIVTFTGPSCSNQSWASFPKGGRYLVENVREALANRGEWYLDRATGELTYLPLPGENPNDTEVIAPRAESLVELRGDPARHAYVEWLGFEGIEFAHTAWNVPAGGHSFPQAEVALPAAIEAVGARDCKLSACAVEHTGAWAIALGAGCQRCVVSGCELIDLGAGGIRIGEMAIREDPEAVAAANSIHHNWIVGGGRAQPAAVGVWIGQSHGNSVDHNEIHDFYYTGVSVGWTWGYGPSLAHHNSISRNHISKIGQGVLSDMGGIYTLGVSPGTILEGNSISDVESYDYGGWGLYTDEGSTGIVLEGNFVTDTKSAGFHQHYGKENVIRRNVFMNGREAQIMRSRAEDHLSFTFEENLVVWDSRADLLRGNFDGDGVRFDRNWYVPVGGDKFLFAGRTPEQWRALGRDQHSTIGAPAASAPESRPVRPLPFLTKDLVPPAIEEAGCARSAMDIERHLRRAPVTFPIRVR
jgi:hypothetical protein